MPEYTYRCRVCLHELTEYRKPTRGTEPPRRCLKCPTTLYRVYKPTLINWDGPKPSAMTEYHPEVASALKNEKRNRDAYIKHKELRDDYQRRHPTPELSGNEAI